MRKCGLLFLAAVMLLQCGCGEKKTSVTVTIQNMTGEKISELTMYSEEGAPDSTNRLDGILAADAEAEIYLGKYTQAQLEKGFALEIYCPENALFESFGGLRVSDGDTVSVYLDDLGLALAVNMTPEEINAQRERDNADIAEQLAAMTEESAAE